MVEEEMRATEGSSKEGPEARRRRQPYRCYLVRCRLEEGAGPAGEAAWRFTVQRADPDAARRSFASLDDVAAHIEADLASCAVANRSSRSSKEETP
jgi:hypothetical protein